uniref:Hemolysin XhlA n=1 Tax=Myoviridae sp. cttph48 TaxID=2825196 RepID=A0A8S5TZS5_9CAUD|nr:MAG TPA: hemolysin XhlA [Myoviridae sp. cttph48]
MEKDEELENRLGTIEKKIDKLADLITQTQLQEYRLSVVEKKLAETAEKVLKLDKRNGDTAIRWLGIIVSGIMTVLISYIAVKVGLK